MVSSQKIGSLLDRAFARFSPDVFDHPVWLFFANSSSQVEAGLVQELLHLAKQLQNREEWVDTCRLLFLCAYYQNLYGNTASAIDNLRRARKLAEHYRIVPAVIWADWGACALSVQKGDYRIAGEYLQHLSTALRENGEWVLADLVELIQQGMLRFAGRTGPAKGNSWLSPPTEPWMRLALEAFLHWGGPANVPIHYESVMDGVPPPAAVRVSRPVIFTSDWHFFWRNVRRVLQGELRLQLVETNQPLSSEQPSGSSALPPALQELRPLSHYLTSATEGAIPNEPTSLPLQAPGNDAEEPAEKPALVIYCLGPFRVYQQDKEITDWYSLKGRDIFKYLLARPETPVPRDILIDTFWPEADPKSARRNLHQAIYSLRQTMRGEQPEFHHIWFENDCYFLNPQLQVWLDCREFEKCIQAGRRLENAGHLEEAIRQYATAEHLYQGDFLQEDLYEDWPILQREYLLNQYLSIVDRLSEIYLQNHQYAAAVPLCQKVLAKDRTYEAAHRQLMQCYLAQDLRHLAIRQYQTCVRALSEELDIKPSEETVALYYRVISQSET